MKKYFSIQLLLLAVIFIGVQVDVTEAKSVTYSNTAFPTDGCFGVNMSYSITYKANAYNDSAGGIALNDNDSVPTGAQIRFQEGPYIDSDISWFATGWTSSSPYGAWVAASGKPSADKFSAYVEPFAGTHQGVLSVNSPINFTVTHTGTAGLSCNSSGNVCTVTSPGSIDAQVNFINRPAEGITSLDGGCNDGWVLSSKIDYSLGYPMPIGGGYDYDWSGNNITFWGAYDRGWVVPPPNPYVLSNYDYSLATYRTTSGIPSQTISFTLTAVSNNNPPTPPTIVGPTTGITNTPYTFTLTGTDPDSDTIRYGIDWNSDNLVDQQIPPSTGVPSTDYVPSGTEQSVDYTWLSVGTYTFQALTEDINSGRSGWTTHTITIDTLPPSPCLLTSINDCFLPDTPSGENAGACISLGACNYSCTNGVWTQNTNSCVNPPENPILSVNKLTVIKDGNVILTWDTNNGNEALCTLTAYSGGQNLIIADGDSAGSVDVTIPARSTYTLSCPNPLDPTAPLTDTVSVDIVPVGVET